MTGWPINDYLQETIHNDTSRPPLLADPGKSVAIASHGNPFYATAGAPYLAEGEAAVVRPLGKVFEIVARVRHDAWRALAKN